MQINAISKPEAFDLCTGKWLFLSLSRALSFSFCVCVSW